VWVDGTKVADKIAGEFPSDASVVAAVKAATGR
jgi:hypothetical protein